MKENRVEGRKDRKREWTVNDGFQQDIYNRGYEKIRTNLKFVFLIEKNNFTPDLAGREFFSGEACEAFR